MKISIIFQNHREKKNRDLYANPVYDNTDFVFGETLTKITASRYHFHTMLIISIKYWDNYT